MELPLREIKILSDLMNLRKIRGDEWEITKFEFSPQQLLDNKTKMCTCSRNFTFRNNHYMIYFTLFYDSNNIYVNIIEDGTNGKDEYVNKNTPIKMFHQDGTSNYIFMDDVVKIKWDLRSQKNMLKEINVAKY